MTKDAPAIAVASGLTGALGIFMPIAGGSVLNYSFDVMGTTLSLESLGFFSATRLVFVPAVLLLVSGTISTIRGAYSRKQALLNLALALAGLGGFFFQKAIIDQLSLVGVTASFGLFLLFTSSLGGALAGLLGLISPIVKEKKQAPKK